MSRDVKSRESLAAVKAYLHPVAAAATAAEKKEVIYKLNEAYRALGKPVPDEARRGGRKTRRTRRSRKVAGKRRRKHTRARRV